MTPDTEVTLPTQQMADVLDGLSQLTVRLLRNDHRTWPGSDEAPWTASLDNVEIGDGYTLSSVQGRGSTPDDAITALYEQVTSVPKSKRIVLRAMRGEERRELRWTGFMWLDDPLPREKVEAGS